MMARDGEHSPPSHHTQESGTIPGSLKVASINVNSLISLSKRYDLFNFVTENDLDIVLICETKLNNNHRLQFSNYELMRTNRANNKNGGGTAILVKNTLPFELIPTPSSRNNKILEYTIIKIKTISLQSNLYLIALYANNDTNHFFIDELNTLFEKLNLNSPNNFYIIAGDFNARHTAWGDSVDKGKGILLKKWLDNEGLEYRANVTLPSEPTFPSAHSYLDLCLSDNRIEFVGLLNGKLPVVDYPSDHKALLFSIIPTAIIPLCDPSLSYRFMYKKTRWSKFEKDLHKSYISTIPEDRNLNNTEISEQLINLQDFISNEIERGIPKYKPNDNILNYTNRKIKLLHKDKSFLITTLNKLLHLNNSSPHYAKRIHDTKNLISKINEQIKSEYSISYNKYWNAQFKSINHRKSSSFFPKINRLFRPKNQLKIDNLELKTTDNHLINRANIDPSNATYIDNKIIINSPIEILNVMGSYFESINAPRYSNLGTPHQIETDNRIHTLAAIFQENITLGSTISKFSSTNPASNPQQINNSVIFTNVLKVHQIMKKLPNKSSSGLDCIPPIIYKHIPMSIVKDYTILFNNCLNNRFFPDTWKRAKIFPVLKKNKPSSETSSYRPISLTPSVSKIFEIVMNESIRKYALENKVIPPNQFGFQPYLSPTHAIHKCLNDITSHLHNNLVVGACLIDLEKAFDSVWINGLLFILEILKFPTDLLQLIWSMTRNRSFILWNGCESSSLIFNIIEGLMQGTVNSPILFNIFTYNIPLLFNLNSGNKTHSIAFADDYIILVADKKPLLIQKKLESLVNNTIDHYAQWNLRPNPKKFETILFHKPLRFINPNTRDEINNFKIKVRHGNTTTTVDHKKSVRYLGVQLDYLLRLHEHIQIQLNKAKNAFRANSRLFFNKSLSTRAKIICYMLLIRPLLSYAAPIWWNASASTIEKLRKFERSCLRACLHIFRASNSKRFICNKIIYNKADIPRIDSFLLKLSRDYYASLNRSNNAYLREYCEINDFSCSDRARTGYLHPHSFMFFDKLGCIQDEHNVPILYHTPRHPSNKTIITSDITDERRHKYAKTLPDRDVKSNYKFANKYWWLARDRQNRDEQRRRSRRIHLSL